MHDLYAFFLSFFVQKSFLNKNYFLNAEINLTTRGPLCTCLVSLALKFLVHILVPIFEEPGPYLVLIKDFLSQGLDFLLVH